MKKIIRKSHALIGLKKDLYKLRLFYLKIKRKKIISAYLKNNEVSKLHIGSNVTVLDGWLCSDLKPVTKSSIYLDAVKTFPFEDNVFDYIYSEHMIEHISQEDALQMLKECFRVLKKNGKIRIATPDLEVIVNLYTKSSEAYGKDYVKWITEKFVKDKSENNPTVVLNTMFRNWDHVFLYDGEMLTKSLEKVGFSNPQRFTLGDSNDPNLKSLERHHLNVGNLEMVTFETMIFEAEKH